MKLIKWEYNLRKSLIKETEKTQKLLNISQRGQGQGVQSLETIDQRNKEYADSLETIAKGQGLWIEDVDEKLEKIHGKRVNRGSEAFVYFKDKDTLVKSRSLIGYKTIQDAIDSIEIHNTLFPETAMKITGFGRSDGEFTTTLEQQYIWGERFATIDEIAEFVKLRFTAEKDDSVIGGTSYKTETHLLQDLKPQNVIVKSINGEQHLYVIDGDFYLCKMSKILFLDIDGVLNTERQHDRCVNEGIAPVDGLGYAFDSEAVANLKRIVEHTGADIVISSSWKVWGLDAMQRLWLRRDLSGQVIDITPRTESGEMLLSVDLDIDIPAVKGSEIKEWLSTNGRDVPHYAILDDFPDMLPEQQSHFVQTDPIIGVTVEDANEIIRILTD